MSKVGQAVPPAHFRTVSPEEGYRRWAATFDASDSAIVALEARHLTPRLTDLGGARVIDIGCGTGRWMGIATDISGVDASAEMLHEAAKKPGVWGRLVLADARCLPFRDASADAVLSTLTIGHVPPVAETLAELARIARPGGLVIVTDFHPEALRRGWSRTFRAGAEVYEIESRPYSLDELHADNLRREEFAELCFDEPERPIFERSGKSNLFEQVRGLPAIWMAIYRRTL
jgi:ubiquinone/menaquinone biosynthesis C-methylase UbiE